jgi:hypothetical protein
MVEENKLPETPATPAAPLTKEQQLFNAFNQALNLITREVNLLYVSVSAIMREQPKG